MTEGSSWHSLGKDGDRALQLTTESAVMRPLTFLEGGEGPPVTTLPAQVHVVLGVPEHTGGGRLTGWGHDTLVSQPPWG